MFVAIYAVSSGKVELNIFTGKINLSFAKNDNRPIQRYIFNDIDLSIDFTAFAMCIVMFVIVLIHIIKAIIRPRTPKLTNKKKKKHIKHNIGDNETLFAFPVDDVDELHHENSQYFADINHDLIIYDSSSE